VVRGDVGYKQRDLPHILCLARAGILPRGRQRCQAVRTVLWIMMPHLGDLVGLRGRAKVPLMPRLCASGSTALNTGRARWCRWWIGGGRFGRVLRMLVEPGLEFGKLSLKLSELLLLLGYNRQQCHKGTLDERGCRGPIIGGDTIWWWYRLHGDSMPGMAAVVKSARFSHSHSSPVNDYQISLYVARPAIRIARSSSQAA
jgi:hypothetical protein